MLYQLSYIPQLSEPYLTIPNFRDDMYNIFQGYRFRRVRKCPKLTRKQISDRFEWCLRNIDNDFLDYIFIDESKIMINQCKLYHLRKKSSYPDCIILDNYFKAKLNVWGGISKRGPIDFVVNNYFFSNRFYLKN